jgi:hypothetical protein
MNKHTYVFSDPSCTFEVTRGIRYLDERSGNFLEIDMVKPIRAHECLGHVYLPPGFTDQQISVVLDRASQAYVVGRHDGFSDLQEKFLFNRLQRQWRALANRWFDFWSP